MHDHSDTRSRESIETIRAIAEIVHGSLDFRTVAERAVGAIITYTPQGASSSDSDDESASSEPSVTSDDVASEDTVGVPTGRPQPV